MCPTRFPSTRTTRRAAAVGVGSRPGLHLWLAPGNGFVPLRALQHREDLADDTDDVVGLGVTHIVRLHIENEVPGAQTAVVRLRLGVDLDNHEDADGSMPDLYVTLAPTRPAARVGPARRPTGRALDRRPIGAAHARAHMGGGWRLHIFVLWNCFRKSWRQARL